MKKTKWFSLCLHVSMVMPLIAAGVRAQSPATVVYTKAQAERGQQVFEKSCQGCHATVPKGKVTSNAPGPDVGGDEFLTRWSGKPVAALAKIMKDTMPNDFSMELTEPMSLDLAAFILQVNKFPDGAAELTTESAKTAIIVK